MGIIGQCGRMHDTDGLFVYRCENGSWLGSEVFECSAEVGVSDGAFDIFVNVREGGRLGLSVGRRGNRGVGVGDELLDVSLGKKREPMDK